MKKLKSFLSRLTSFFRKNSEKVFVWLKHHKKFAIFFLIIFFLWVSIIAFGSKRYADESYHYRQVGMFYKQKFEMAKGLTTVPGYHAILAIPSHLLFSDLSFFRIRLLAFPLSLLIIPVFFLLSRKISSGDPWDKTLTLLLLPVAFVYYPLIYTDIFSSFLFLLALYLSLNKKYHWAALISIISICVRQQNIVWHLFIWTYPYISLYGFNFSFKNISNHLRATIGFFIGVVLFAFFVKFNGGIAIGDKESHQLGIYFGNIYFFLFLAGILFWPMLIKRLLENKNIIKNKFTWLILGIALLISSLLFFYPPAVHGYNNDPNFIRNIFLAFVYNGHLGLYAILIFLGTISLASLKFNNLSNYLVYPFTVLCLFPSWLIEQRYTIIPFLLILLFRREEKPSFENILKIYYLALCVVLVFVLIKLRIFL